MSNVGTSNLTHVSAKGRIGILRLFRCNGDLWKDVVVGGTIFTASSGSLVSPLPRCAKWPIITHGAPKLTTYQHYGLIVKNSVSFIRQSCAPTVTSARVLYSTLCKSAFGQTTTFISTNKLDWFSIKTNYLDWNTMPGGLLHWHHWTVTVTLVLYQGTTCWYVG